MRNSTFSQKFHKLPSNYLSVIPIGVLATAIYAPTSNFLNYPDGEAAYQFLSNICHQDFFRSFSIASHPLGLCARCAGGYCGVAFGLLLLNFQRLVNVNRLLLLYSIGSSLLLLSIIDALVKISDGNIQRFFSGGVGGIGAGIMMLCFVSIYMVRKK